MAESVARKDWEPIQQFSIFADNKVGRMNELLQRMAQRDIHVMAISVLDTTENTIIRVVVDYPKFARELFQDYEYAFTETLVIAVELVTEADIRKVTQTLMEAEINIHYLYPFFSRPNGRSGLILSVDDPELAETVLSACGLKVLSQMDISR
ncbi:MAG: acetolactate synthase [Verrucomicrobiota bacterium]|nr:acetolactate synthase [Verrucomicrobiota bacterium]